MAAVAGERWSLGFHAPEADSLEKTARPAVNGGSVLPRGGKERRFESRQQKMVCAMWRRTAKLSQTVCGSCDAPANGDDGCWEPVLYLSSDITWCRGKDQLQIRFGDMLAESCWRQEATV